MLSANISHGAHYSGLSARNADSEIIRALGSRYEMADGGVLHTFTVEAVITQVVADTNALLRFLGANTATDATDVRAALQSASALEGVALVNPPARAALL